MIALHYRTVEMKLNSGSVVSGAAAWRGESGRDFSPIVCVKDPYKYVLTANNNASPFMVVEWGDLTCNIRQVRVRTWYEYFPLPVSIGAFPVVGLILFVSRLVGLESSHN